MESLYEIVTFSHVLNNKSDSSFNVKNTIEFDLTEMDVDQQMVNLVTHFIGLWETMGYSIELLFEVFVTVLESYQEYLDEELEEEEDSVSLDKELIKEELKSHSINNFDSFEKDVLNSKDFRKYLFTIFKDEHSG